MNKSVMNIVFAAIVVLLASTAIASLDFTTKKSIPVPAPAMESRSGAATTTLSDKADSLERLVAAHPDEPQYVAQLGNLYYDSGDYVRAAEYYRRCLQIRPEDPYVETDLATCYHYSGQNDEALRTLNHVLQYQPDFAQARFNKGVVLIEGLRDIRAGIAAWEELLRLNPDYPERAALERRVAALKKEAGL